MTNQNSNSNEVTITYDLVTPKCNHSIHFIIEVIRSNQYKETVQIIRQMISTGFKEEANKLKKTLPGATFSCRYERRRCLENVTHYNGFVLLDADHLDAATLVRIVAMLPANPWVYAFFRSPGGCGLKILVKTNGLQKHHAHTYKQVMSFFASFLKIKFDEHTSDIVRLCFLSWDPNAFLNPGAWTFQVSEPAAVIAREERPKQSLHYEAGDCFAFARNDVSKDYIFRKCVRFTNRRCRFTEGNRNNFIFLLSCYCRMNGLSKEDTEQQILRHYNYSQREILTTVKSAYRYGLTPNPSPKERGAQ